MPRPRALLLVRNTFAHDARVLRAARVLSDDGFEPLVVAVMSTEERRATQIVGGIPVLRLDPRSPLGWLRAKIGRAETPGPAAAPMSPGLVPVRPGHWYPAVVRFHRWMRTIDFYRRALGVVRREKPALLHCNDYNTMWVGVLSRLVGRPAVVYDTHELWPDRNLRPEPRWWLLSCEWMFVRRADVIVAASPGYADVVARRYRVPRPAVVRNIPRSDGPVVPAPPDEPLVAVYVGAVAPNRGIEQMLAALPLVPGMRFRLLGPVKDGYLGDVLAVAERFGVRDRLEIVPPVATDDVLRSLRGVAFGVALFQPTCLSHTLVAPNKVFEYLAAGLPSLVSDLPVIREFVESHGVGRAVPGHAPECIAEAARLLLEPVENLRMRAAVRAAAQTVTWERERLILAAAYERAREHRG